MCKDFQQQMIASMDTCGTSKVLNELLMSRTLIAREALNNKHEGKAELFKQLIEYYNLKIKQLLIL